MERYEFLVFIQHQKWCIQLLADREIVERSVSLDDCVSRAAAMTLRLESKLAGAQKVAPCDDYLQRRYAGSAAYAVKSEGRTEIRIWGDCSPY